MLTLSIKPSAFDTMITCHCTHNTLWSLIKQRSMVLMIAFVMKVILIMITISDGYNTDENDMMIMMMIMMMVMMMIMMMMMASPWLQTSSWW